MGHILKTANSHAESAMEYGFMGLIPEPSCALVSRNVVIHRRRTSIRLEADMWVALFDICAREKMSIGDICGCVMQCKSARISLTAAMRVFIMGYFRMAATEEGHKNAGHGAVSAIRLPASAGAVREAALAEAERNVALLRRNAR